MCSKYILECTHLLLSGEGGEKADVRAALHEARGVEAQDERVLARGVLHGHLVIGLGLGVGVGSIGVGVRVGVGWAF